MNRQELELIAALAEGSLDNETEARHLVASSPEFQAEYEAQRTAIESLRQVPEARLTEHERSALRRDVWTELRAQTAGRKLATPWYYRWSTVAAGLVLIVGLVAVLNQSDSTVALSQPDDLAEFAAETGPAATTSLAAEEAMDGASAPLASDDLKAGAEEDSSVLADIASRLRSSSTYAAGLLAIEDQAEMADLESCVIAAGLEGHEILGLTEIPQSIDFILIVSPNLVTADTPISFIDIGTCKVLYTDG